MAILNCKQQEVLISQINIGDRQRTDYGDLSEMESSLKDVGQLQQIGVREDESGALWLVWGGRRLRAATNLGWDRIRANVFRGAQDEASIALMEFHENAKRKDLTFQEQIKAKKRLLELGVKFYGKAMPGVGDAGWGIKETAALLGESEATVSEDIKLATAMEQIPELKLDQSKNKSEAKKVLRNLERAMLVKQLQDVQDAKSPKIINQKGLINSYCIEDFLQANVTYAPSFVEVDPPYGIDLSGSLKYLTAKQSEELASKKVDLDQHLAWLRQVYQKCWDVMDPNSWLFTWFAMHPVIYPELYKMLTEIGFQIDHVPGVWTKGMGVAWQSDTHLRCSCEFFLYGRKGRPAIATQHRINQINFPKIQGQKKEHPTEKPIAMYEYILETFIHGGMIMSPFAGSGNIILAAHNRGLLCVGYDVSEEYLPAYTSKVLTAKDGDKFTN